MGHCKRFLNEGRKEEKEGGKEDQEELSKSKAYLPVGVFPVDGMASQKAVRRPGLPSPC